MEFSCYKLNKVRKNELKVYRHENKKQKLKKTSKTLSSQLQIMSSKFENSEKWFSFHCTYMNTFF